ncbi:uncharacterized protein EI90DRAFT_3071344 [Cantharellus anzutake]|uniref:uncharacterized protein n=1 Tax=Cantharellus anzutake TaxID=1750568 RepID=UPI0019055B9E|nr:uncharacterized protein EI90DRAFT_3071344 [Cantharellus anzutake]KAF8326056.1 hypothetical protein EI90DRAFT_3071344 [Cantharellus anzutake]
MAQPGTPTPEDPVLVNCEVRFREGGVRSETFSLMHSFASETSQQFFQKISSSIERRFSMGWTIGLGWRSYTYWKGVYAVQCRLDDDSDYKALCRRVPNLVRAVNSAGVDMIVQEPDSALPPYAPKQSLGSPASSNHGRPHKRKKIEENHFDLDTIPGRSTSATISRQDGNNWQDDGSLYGSFAAESQAASPETQPDQITSGAAPEVHNYMSLPISAYCWGFGVFLDLLQDTSGTLPVDMYRKVRLFSAAVLNDKISDDDRTAAIMNSLKSIIGKGFSTAATNGKSSGNVVISLCPQNQGGSLIEENAITLIIPDVRPMSVSSHVAMSVHGNIYSNIVSQIDSSIRRMCCCPSFILTLAGPWMCISGSVLLESSVVEPLTEFIWLDLGKNSRRLEYLSRVFRALVHAMKVLEESYRTLHTIPHGPPKFPCFLSFSMRGGTYGLRCYELLSFPAVFLAELIDQSASSTTLPVVAKFVPSYAVDAHKLLAEANLAPGFLHLERLPGGMQVVVMEHVAGTNASEMGDEWQLSERHLEQIQQAVELLHENGFVHGDLQACNIIIEDDTNNAKLVDFDWTAKDGEGRYPMDLKEDIDMEWCEGVEPGAVMTKGHDIYMLGILRRNWAALSEQ